MLKQTYSYKILQVQFYIIGGLGKIISRIGIVTDSHSSITQDEADRLGIKILPMPFYIGGECYYEGKI